MKKSPPQKKAVSFVEIAATRKKKAAPSQSTESAKPPSTASGVVSPMRKKNSPQTVSLKETSKEGTPKKRRPATAKNNLDALLLDTPQPQIPLVENSPPMISLKSPAKCKKNRRKTARNRSFYGLEEIEFELEDQEFLDEELISLEEFDSILNETKGKNFKNQSTRDDFEDNLGEMELVGQNQMTERREDLLHSPGSDKLTRRKKVQRRRQIDPTTCERDYTTEEVEFMTALDDYKRNSGRMFPTCSEILEVLRGLGYAKVPSAPVVQEQTTEQIVEQAAEQTTEQMAENIAESIPVIGTEFIGTQSLTLIVENFAPEFQLALAALNTGQDQEHSSHSPPPVIETPVFPDVFPAKDYWVRMVWV